MEALTYDYQSGREYSVGLAAGRQAEAAAAEIHDVAVADGAIGWIIDQLGFFIAPPDVLVRPRAAHEIAQVFQNSIVMWSYCDLRVPVKGGVIAGYIVKAGPAQFRVGIELCHAEGIDAD